jgi:hypothetical protein
LFIFIIYDINNTTTLEVKRQILKLMLWFYYKFPNKKRKKSIWEL